MLDNYWVQITLSMLAFFGCVWLIDLYFNSGVVKLWRLRKRGQHYRFMDFIADIRMRDYKEHTLDELWDDLYPCCPQDRFRNNRDFYHQLFLRVAANKIRDNVYVPISSVKFKMQRPSAENTVIPMRRK